MTSKAAKKAYKKATALPKLSKAEQRRIEKEELERQRKEYERERAAAKAKAAREKKQEKERKQREERKRLGIPEKSRWVHASQPTIKGFVESVSGGRKSWEDSNAESGTYSEGESRPIDHQESHSQNIKVFQGLKDNISGDFPLSSLKALLEPQLTNVDNAVYNGSDSKPQTAHVPENISSRYINRSPQLDKENASVSDKKNARSSAGDADPPLSTRSVTAGGLNVTAQATAKVTGRCTIAPQVQQISVEKQISDPVLRKPSRPEIRLSQAPKRRGFLKDISANILPPPVPVVTKYELREQTDEASQSMQKDYECPPSTLVFLESHLNDFFPCPSQQVRELLSDLDYDDMPSNTQTARDIGFMPHSGTRDESIKLQSIQQSPRHDQHSSILSAGWEVFGSHDLSLFSSQDLEISSQDLRDIDTPEEIVTLSTEQPTVSVIASEIIRVTQPANPELRSKACFFEEKEEDLLQAALDESLKLARQQYQQQQPEPQQPASPMKLGRRSFARVLSAQTDYGDNDFSDADPELLAVLQHIEESRQ